MEGPLPKPQRGQLLLDKESEMKERAGNDARKHRTKADLPEVQIREWGYTGGTGEKPDNETGGKRKEAQDERGKGNTVQLNSSQTVSSRHRIRDERTKPSGSDPSSPAFLKPSVEFP